MRAASRSHAKSPAASPASPNRVPARVPVPRRSALAASLAFGAAGSAGPAPLASARPARTLRTVTSPLRLDGPLDEAVSRELRPASDFIQEDPDVGAPATERTEIWVMYDDETVYGGGRMWESEPVRMIANEMRKDSPMVFQNESLTIAFDTFYDRRNGVAFVISWTPAPPCICLRKIE